MKRVFTNGCFDILHVGHLRLLEFCKERGYVIVGLNSDASVRRLKGISRPINSEDERRELLLGLKSVDEVIIFEDDTPLSLIKELKPDLLVKGGDYLRENVVGFGIVEVELFPHQFGHSTTSIIERTKVNKNGIERSMGK